MISTRDNRVRIIDLRLAINFFPDGQDGVHRPLAKYGFQGTPLYGSIDTLRGYNSGRKDDLEGLGYTIMALIDQNAVPWNNIQTKEKIADSKE